MSVKSPPSAAPARRGSMTSVWVWVVAALFWLYYMSPVFVRSTWSWYTPVVLGGAGLVAVAVLLLRHRAPQLSVLLIGGCLFVSPAAVGAAFAAQAMVAARQGRSTLVVLTGGWVVLTKIGGLLIGPSSDPSGWTQPHSVELGICVIGIVVATLAGWLTRSRADEEAIREDAASARREADQARMERVRLGERERIAREMHDVLAHRISLVAMHSAALAHRDDLDPQTTRDTAAVIQQNAKSALDELRVVLSGLRDDNGGPEPPQPRLDQLPQLVAAARESGQRVQLSVTGDPAALPDQIGRSAYRIIQEALTNARKHAPGAQVEVEVVTEADQLSITASNPLTELALPTATGAGLGLVGVAERVELLGGTVHSTEVDQRFRLTVRLPIAAAEESP